jgi:hypothetical protein
MKKSCYRYRTSLARFIAAPLCLPRHSEAKAGRGVFDYLRKFAPEIGIFFLQLLGALPTVNAASAPLDTSDPFLEGSSVPVLSKEAPVLLGGLI